MRPEALAAASEGTGMAGESKQLKAATGGMKARELGRYSGNDVSLPELSGWT